MTRPNSVTTNYAYDNLSRLTSVLHQLSGSTIDGATYTLDNAWNRTAKTDQRTSVASNFAYDNIYQLTGVTQGATTTESYAYDAVGNRTSSLGVASYTTNSSNEMTANSNASFTYDNNGNTLTKTDSSGTTTYAWDYENRLSSVTLPSSGGTVSFVYDPIGRRIKKVTSSTSSVFAYDGDNLVEETNGSGSVVARYSLGLNIDEPLAMLRSSSTNYYNADGLGTITSLAGGTGSLAQTYTFDSFGKQTASSGSLTNSFQYTARESDPETGLYYYRARYYDSSSGRFLSEDPIAFTGGIDFYTYVSNNPPTLFDPSGLAQVCCRPANVGFAASWAQRTHRPPPCHCFVKLSNGDTLGGYFSYWLPVMLVKRQNDNSDHDKYSRQSECRDLPGSPCDSDARAKSAFDAYPKVRGPYGTEPGDVGTSNRVASELLQDAGFGSVLPLPSCAWGQTGADGSFFPIKGFVKGLFPIKIFSLGIPDF